MRADRGCVDCTGEGELMEACAVLEEMEAVGGPDEKMDLFGVLKSEGWLGCGGGLEVLVEAGRSSSGAEFVWYRGGGRGEKIEPSPGLGG